MEPIKTTDKTKATLRDYIQAIGSLNGRIKELESNANALITCVAQEKNVPDGYKFNQQTLDFDPPQETEQK